MASDQSAEYLLRTQAIVTAGRRLRDSLGQPAQRQFAIDQLVKAAEQQDAIGQTYRAFMFSSLEVAAPTAPAAAEVSLEAALATITTDLQVADVLIAAGQAAGETSVAPDAQRLDEALLRLDNSRRSLEQGLKSADGGRFGFAASGPVPAAAASANLDTATRNFKKQADATLKEVVASTQDVVKAAVDKLSDLLLNDKVKEALGQLGDQLPNVPKIGPLLDQGIKKLRAAFDALVRLVGKGAIDKLKDKLQQVWDNASDGKLLPGILRGILQVDSTTNRIAAILRLTGLDQTALDRASDEIVLLTPRFKDTAGMLKAVVYVVGGIAVILAFTPAAPYVPVGSGILYGTIVAVTLLIAMDYVGGDGLLRRVQGVGEIAETVRPA